MLMTVDECRAYVSSSLTDDALLLLLIATEADITAAAGAMAAQTVYIRGGYESLVLDHPAGTMTSVTERSDTPGPLLLAADDYRVDGYILHRLTTGTNPRPFWLGLVKVVHTPPEAEAERVRAQVALVRLELAVASGVVSESIGDWSASYGGASTYEGQKAAILASLKPPMIR